MPRDDPVFDEALLRVLYRLNAFDLSGLGRDRDVLGAIYQGILDRRLRKDVGEFYTDQEIVEYILARVGLKDAVESGAQVRLLDPACGSGAFLVHAAGIVRQADARRGLPNQDIRERITAAVHGLDINHFAVYIADMNLLFATFDMTAEAGQSPRFSVHRINSLLPDGLLPSELAGLPDRDDPYEDAASHRDATYEFVVGNPPYVRAERLPDFDRAQLKRVYQDVHGGGNVDLAVYFVRRALDWLEPGGRLGLILPRAIADAAFAAPLRAILEQDDLTIEEFVPLDWACHELFDSDVVPFLLFVRRWPRPKGHKVALVQGLRSKTDISARARGQTPAGTRTSRIPWAAFKRHSRTGWALEITPDDLPILDALRRRPTLDSVAHTRFGIKAGSTGAAGELAAGAKAEGAWVPMLTGAEIHAFATGPPRRTVLLDEADDPSLWATCLTPRGSPLPDGVVVVANIHVALNAAVIDPRSVSSQNTTMVIRPANPGAVSAHALCAVLNSRAARYHIFHLGRAGVAGGGRRDFTACPRALNALPLPFLTTTRWSRLDRLSRLAHEYGGFRAQTDAELWQRAAAADSRVPVRDWPLDFTGWPDGHVLTTDHFSPRLEAADRALWLTADISISGEPDLLRCIGHHLDAYFCEAIELSKRAFMRLRLPAPADVPAVLARFEALLADRQKAEARYWRAVELIDDIVEPGLGLSRELRERLARRMTEFPLNENANRPRLPWEETKKPRARRFIPGERYHER
jgi:SAM-dependent methyltransferase